jgi:hypothetical protein
MKKIFDRQKRENEQLIQDSIKVRGIAAAIQSMSFPSFKNLDELLNKVGYKIVKISENNN